MNQFFDGMPIWTAYIALPLIGVIAGFVNTMAGGGSFLTLPALMFFFDLSPKAANATNRLSVLLQTGTSTAMFHKHGFTDIRLAFKLLLPALCGSTLGGYITEILPADWFSLVFGGAMLTMAIVLFFKPRLLLATDRHPMQNPAGEFFTFFLIGIYGGFLQAGVGLLLLVGLTMFHPKDLAKSNAVKVTIAFLQTFPPIAIFAWHGQIVWGYGLLLALGTMTGAVIGAKFAIKKGAKSVFTFVVIVAILTSIKLIWSGLSAIA
ncbi:sulfite exporter TauE/SafE family protein [Poriferisphaera corsica]|uniref:sulfite exporter TauE/SafE family protein n=1 Tax=Poriferisphaera corsica TaxID=2528020 RepID=UPI00190D54C5|nr:sulfite exporter TauE/SafE family protein [Poriferisphaera corsica]